MLWAVCVYFQIIYMPIFVQRAFGFRRLTLGISAGMMIVAVQPADHVAAGVAHADHAHHRAEPLLHRGRRFCRRRAGNPVGDLSDPYMLDRISLAYNAAVTVVCGFAPTVRTWAWQHLDRVLRPEFYVTAAAAISLAVFSSCRNPYASNLRLQLAERAIDGIPSWLADLVLQG